MYIQDISLYHFRNYKTQQIEFNSAINVLVGFNGQGKTNILESIFYLLMGKSYRVRQESELIQWGEKEFYLKALFQIKNRNIKLESYYKEKGKTFLINGIPSKRLSDYVGTVNVVFFSPDDLGIIKKNPQERRKYLDLIISQNKPSHIYDLNAYLKVVKQKSALLHMGERSNSLFKEQLRVWNQNLLETGRRIIQNRWEYTEQLNFYSQDIFSAIFSEKEKIAVSYFSLGKRTLQEAWDYFEILLENKLEQEIEKRCILAGPHRDDIFIDLNDRPAKYFASQGQQRTIILSLKLAEMELIKKKKGEYPILLLDDVLSELDEKRRGYLLEYIHATGKQTLITMTERDEKISLEEAAFFRVEEGKVRREI